MHTSARRTFLPPRFVMGVPSSPCPQHCDSAVIVTSETHAIGRRPRRPSRPTACPARPISSPDSRIFSPHYQSTNNIISWC
jgi:hypothetical protein